MTNNPKISDDRAGLAKLVSQGNRMQLLLLTLLVWMVFAPFISETSLLSVLLMVVVVAAAVTVATTRRAVITAVFLGIAPFVLSAVSVAGNDTADPIRNILVLIFLLYVIRLMLQYIVFAREVGAEIIYGAIACYLLIGVLWMILHLLLEYYQPGSYAATSGAPLVPFDFLYFSLVTLTTLGYGDITPVSQFAKGISVLEAISGVFYMGLIISRLVALVKHDPEGTPA